MSGHGVFRNLNRSLESNDGCESYQYRLGSLAQSDAGFSAALSYREFRRGRAVCHETPTTFRQAASSGTDPAMRDPEIGVLKRQPVLVYVGLVSAAAAQPA